MAEKKKIVDNVSARSNASQVWKNFGFYLDSNNKPDKSKAVCKICFAEKPYVGGSTSNLRTHLNTYHSNEVKASQPKSEPSITQHFEKLSTKAMSKDSREFKAITNKITHWLISDLMPLSTVEKPAFRSMIETLNPRYKAPCKDTFTNKFIPDVYNGVKAKVAEEITNYNSFACTTDGWTSANTESYVTGLFIRS